MGRHQRSTRSGKLAVSRLRLRARLPIIRPRIDRRWILTQLLVKFRHHFRQFRSVVASFQGIQLIIVEFKSRVLFVFISSSPLDESKSFGSDRSTQVGVGVGVERVIANPRFSVFQDRNQTFPIDRSAEVPEARGGPQVRPKSEKDRRFLPVAAILNWPRRGSNPHGI
jgi:hypothetical protein